MDYADTNGDTMKTPFTCKNVNANKIQACAVFSTQSEALSFGDYLNEQLESLAEGLGWQNQYVPNGEGGVTCIQAELAFTITNQDTGEICGQGVISQTCQEQRTEFPYCNCAPGTPAGTPYRVSYDQAYNSSGSNVYCFKLDVEVKAGTCGNMGLTKVEWLTRPECQQSVEKFWLSSKPTEKRAPVFGRYNDQTYGHPTVVLRTNQLGLTTSSAKNTHICFSLKADSKCNSIEKFCTPNNDASTFIGCQYATFDDTAGCCSANFMTTGFQSQGDRRRVFRLA